MNKCLVLYLFHIFNERVKYFFEHAIFQDENVDFIIICNDTKQNYDNIIPSCVKKIIYRENIGYDFGGWSEAILTDNNYDNYDKFIFVNSSVIGPFLKDKNIKWTDLYLNPLNENIKLFGSTINVYGKNDSLTHVQSYIFSMDKTTLKYLIECEIFSLTNVAKTFNDAIQQKEILMSRKIINNNWNIGCLLNIYKNINFITNGKINTKYTGDLLNQRCYKLLWDEYQLVFIKGNRNIKL